MKHLTLHQKTAYAAPAFSLAVVGIPVYVYIPKFYTDVVGVNIAVLGIILLGVRLFDAVTDPVVGLLSDRLQTPYGRRRPLIALGAVLTAVAIVLLFNPPRLSPAMATAWFLVFMTTLFLFWTVITVPYESLGPELTYDYNERVALFGVRDGALIAGTLAAAAAPALVRSLFQLPDTGPGERQVFFILSAGYVPLILACTGWCLLIFQERQPRTISPPQGNVFSGFTASLKNRPFRILLIAYTISAIGNNLPATLILYYVEYVLHSNMADLFLVLYFVTGVGFLPLWVAGARWFDKKNIWLLAMALNTGAFSGVFFLGPGDEWLYGVLVVISGIGFGATLAIPSAIQADVIDYDELITGRRREGLYIGLWSIAKKLAAAVGVGVGLALLGASGYEPNIRQSATVVTMLRVLYALVPCACNLIAIVVALRYPVTRHIHEQIRHGIGARFDGEPVQDPLAPETLLPALAAE
ncbi:MAG: glycoside-pentoside-hexuronide (GPH):cation symporter [Thermodesulfobacteriota bacterium]|nr:glycoside-pentoside-hexuronide (GPH):cation symporter [Thermodesulfobacteriota bacterium]